MLSEEDYKEYLEQMAQLERQMLDAYAQCALLVDDEVLKVAFLSIVEDEKRHLRLVNSLKEFFLG